MNLEPSSHLSDPSFVPSPCGFILSLDARIQACSAGTELALGWRASALIGMSLLDLSSAAYASTVRAALANAVAGRESVEQIALVRGDGLEVQGWLALAPLVDDAGVIVSVGAAYIDASEMLTKERALRESEERFRSLAAASPMGVFMADVGGMCTYTNARCQDIGGFTFEQSLGEGWASFVHPDDRAGVRKGWADAVTQGAPWSTEFRFLRPDGAVRWVSVRSSPMVSDGGNIIGFVGTAEDITERLGANMRLAAALDAEREARERAERARDDMESVLSSVTDGLIAFGPDWRVTTLNRAAEEYYETVAGVSRDEIIGNSLWDSFPEVFETEFGRGYIRAMDEQIPVVIEGYYAPFGRWFEVRVFPRRPGISVYFRDVTERKRSEDFERARSAEQKAIAELGIRALRGGEMDSLIADIVQVVAKTLDIPAVRFLDLLPDVRSARLRAGVGWKEGTVGSTFVPLKDTQIGHAVSCGEPVVVDDWSEEDRFRPAPMLVDHAIVSSAAVLVHGKQGPLGVLAADSRDPGRFGEHDVHFLQAVANLISISVERTTFEDELRTSLEQLQVADRARRDLMSRMVGATEQERRRIARDIHDDSIQVVAGVSIRLEALDRVVPDDLKPQTEALRRTAQRAVASLRTLVFDLQPIALEEEGLAVALQQQLERLAADGGFTFDVQDDLETEPGFASRSLLYRVAREALTNVHKHAHATHVVVGLSSDEGGTTVFIEDDGCGFEPSYAKALTDGHLGLFSMRNDAETVGGWCEVRSKLDGGTRVEFHIPEITNDDAIRQGLQQT